jgi:hypothetical protein
LPTPEAKAQAPAYQQILSELFPLQA